MDARVRKHSKPEAQRAYGNFTIALGPELVAGCHADVVIETSWDGLGPALTKGATRPLAPLDGVLRGLTQDGAPVSRRQAHAILRGLRARRT